MWEEAGINGPVVLMMDQTNMIGGQPVRPCVRVLRHVNILGRAGHGRGMYETMDEKEELQEGERKQGKQQQLDESTSRVEPGCNFGVVMVMVDGRG